MLSVQTGNKLFHILILGGYPFWFFVESTARVADVNKKKIFFDDIIKK